MTELAAIEVISKITKFPEYYQIGFVDLWSHEEMLKFREKQELRKSTSPNIFILPTSAKNVSIFSALYKQK